MQAIDKMRPNHDVVMGDKISPAVDAFELRRAQSNSRSPANCAPLALIIPLLACPKRQFRLGYLPYVRSQSSSRNQRIYPSRLICIFLPLFILFLIGSQLISSYPHWHLSCCRLLDLSCMSTEIALPYCSNSNFVCTKIY
jgi:hypothetical protein